MSVIIGGHRGSGCTDSAHAQTIGQKKAPENTLESIQAAIDNGAKLIEIDVIQTADNKLVVTHSNQLSDHVFTTPNPGVVADYTFEELQQFDVGLEGTHKMPLLADVLGLCENVILNIEIKDIKGTETPKFAEDRPPLVDLLTAEIRDYKGALILSSFSTWDLEAMKERLPDVPRAQLFDTAAKEERPIYDETCPDKSVYMQFTVENILEAIRRADVQYAHPCIDSMNADVVAKCAEHNLGINTWALGEVLPENDKAAIQNAVSLCREHGVQLGLITDYTPEMLELLPQLNVGTALKQGLEGLVEGPDL